MRPSDHGEHIKVTGDGQDLPTTRSDHLSGYYRVLYIPRGVFDPLAQSGRLHAESDFCITHKVPPEVVPLPIHGRPPGRENNVRHIK